MREQLLLVMLMQKLKSLRLCYPPLLLLLNLLQATMPPLVHMMITSKSSSSSDHYLRPPGPYSYHLQLRPQRPPH